MTAVPVIDDVALTFVQEMEHHLDAGFVSTPVLGLDGDVQQRSNRRSHRMRIAGLLVGPEEQVKTDLEKLQQKAADGAEVIFTADIVSALELQKVVVRSLRVLARAGTTPSYSYEIELAESPPLPPPAQVSAFGGLDDFGFGDLGFDTDILGDLADLAGEVASAVETAVDVIGALDSLSALGNLSFDGVLAPLDQIGTSLAAIGSRFGDAGGALAGVFGQ
jgi:hypothetical protein